MTDLIRLDSIVTPADNADFFIEEYWPVMLFFAIALAVTAVIVIKLIKKRKQSEIKKNSDDINNEETR